MWIERKISSTLQELAGNRPVVVVTGARQTGKTSLLRGLFPQHRYVSLDLPAVAAEADLDSAGFLHAHPPPVLLDEIQYAPQIFRTLKLDVDAHRLENGRFLLTGSQKFLLMQGVSDSLAGRASIVELETLSYSEIRAHYPDVPLEEFLLRGGYPELWANLALDPVDYYRSYLATYIERDIRSLLNIGSLRDFERFVRACALRSGRLLNKSDLARDVGISPSTAGQWISLLETSGQIYLLEPWFANGTKSLVKTPKLYWTDVGFLNYLVGIRTVSDLQSSPLIGAIWETFVCAELRKRMRFANDDTTLFFWRDRSREVDFLIHRGGRFELFEAKWSFHPTEEDSEALRYVSNALGEQNILSRRVIARPSQSFPLKSSRVVNLDSDWFER